MIYERRIREQTASTKARLTQYFCRAGRLFAVAFITSGLIAASQTSASPQGGGISVELSLGCLKVPERSAAAVLAEDFKRRLVAYAKEDLSAPWSDTPRTCDEGPDRLAENAVVVGGWVDDRPLGQISFKPVLWRRHFPGALPLPTFAAPFDTYTKMREEYLRLVVTTIGATVHERDLDRIAFAIYASGQSDATAAKAGQRLLAESKPHLALSLLQRGVPVRSPDILFDLGVAYQQGSAVRFAEDTFRQVLKIDPRHARAHLELGSILLNSGRYREAASELKQAGKLPGALSKYAIALFFIDDKEQASVEAQKALKAGERSAALTLLLVRQDIAGRKFMDAIGRLKEGLDKDLEPNFAPTLLAIAASAEREKDFEAADYAYNELIGYRPAPVAYMLYGRGLVARAETQGPHYAVKAADMFKIASGATQEQRREEPQLKVVELEQAEALFIAGDSRSAGLVAQRFKPDADPTASTESYVPVAQLILAASEYLARKQTEDPRTRFDRVLGDGNLPYPELALSASLSGRSVRYVLARWDFSALDNYVCASLDGQDRETVLGLSKHVQRRVAERGGTVEEGCPKPDKQLQKPN